MKTMKMKIKKTIKKNLNLLKNLFILLENNIKKTAKNII